MNEDIEITKKLYSHIMGERSEITRSFEALVERVRSGEKGLIIEVPWKERISGEQIEKNNIVIMRLEGERVFFCNPYPRREKVAGEVAGSDEEGPKRRLEPSGEESMTLLDLEELFAKGGSAILPAQ